MTEQEQAPAPAPLKRVVIKEELVALTGDYIAALILNQFLYWSRRTRDFDRFLAEERSRDPELRIEPTHGWIYKTAEDLADELMIGCSIQTIGRHIAPLVEAGWLAQRHNPRHAWDRTYQYRPDILAIQRDLQALGYALDDYPLLIAEPTSKMDPPSSKMENRGSKTADRSVKNGRAIPETTTEIIPETTAETTDQEPGADAPAAPRPPVPTSWPEWEHYLDEGKNPAALARRMVEVLYPGRELPAYSQVGGIAKRMGRGRDGYRRLMGLIWEHSHRPPDGDLLPYLLRVHLRQELERQRADADHTSKEGRRRYAGEHTMPIGADP